MENGNAYNSKIDEVRGNATVATGSYGNGGFTLNLPATVDDQYLRLFREAFWDSSVLYLAEISDTDAKISELYIHAYKSGAVVGYFFYCNRNLAQNLEKNLDRLEAYKEYIRTHYVYADRDVSITGYKSSGTGSYVSFSLFLKKGWNKTYLKRSSTENTHAYEVTSTEPSGLIWYFDFVENSNK